MISTAATTSELLSCRASTAARAGRSDDLLAYGERGAANFAATSR